MVSIVFFYFIDVKKISVANESTSQVSAVVIGDYRFEGRTSHLYYYQALKSTIVRKETDIGAITSLSPAFSLILVFVCLYALVMVFLRKRDIDTINLRFPPIAFLVPFLAAVIAVYSLWLGYFDIKAEPILFTNIYGKLITAIFFLVAVVIFTISIGRRIRNFVIKDSLGALADFLLSFAFGIAVLSFVYFCLALFGVLSFVSILVVLALILVFSFKSFLFWLKTIFVTKIHFSVKLLSPTLFLLFIFFSFVAQNTLEAMRPVPIGHDDLIQYAKNIKLLGESGSLIGGVLPIPWELFVSQVNILSHSWTVTSFFNSLKSVLAFVSLYFLADYFCRIRKIKLFSDDKFIPLLIATIFYTLPMVVFQSAVDLKVDLAALFFSLMATFILIKWKENNKVSYLFIAFFLLGFAFAIKITSIFYIAGIAVYVLYIFIQQKMKIFRILKIVGFCIIFFLISFAPYALNSASTLGVKKAAQALFISSKGELPTIHLLTKEDRSEISELPEYNKLSGENGARDLSKFKADGSTISNMLSLPFIVTLNSKVTGEFVDITFLFLAIIPVSFIVLLFRRKEEKDRSGLLRIASIVFIIAFGLWLVYASGIVWYGMAIVIPTLLLLAESLKLMSKYYKSVLVIAFVLIFSWLILSMVYRLTYNPKYLSHIMPKDLTYLRGTCDEQCYTSFIFTENKTIKIINENNKTEEKGNIYMTGKLLDFLINNSNRNTLFDNYETFSEIHQEKDDALTIQRLKKANFKYIIISRFSHPIYLHADIINQAKQEMYDFVSKNPDRIKIINDPSQDGSIIAEIL
jgi:hypothetical protein